VDTVQAEFFEAVAAEVFGIMERRPDLVEYFDRADNDTENGPGEYEEEKDNG